MCQHAWPGAALLQHPVQLSELCHKLEIVAAQAIAAENPAACNLLL